MKCSDCSSCKAVGEYFQCDNREANAYGLEIFNPNNAGCKSGTTESNNYEEVIQDANVL